MKNAFTWLFRSIAGSLAALIAVQLVVVGLGLPLILGAYENYRQSEFENLAIEIIKGSEEARETVQGMESSFFVFSADRNLIYSNRGKGKSISEADLIPIQFGPNIVGYYRALELQFLDTKANRVFFNTLMLLLGGTVLVSSAIGLLFAYRAAGNISRPVEILLSDLETLEYLQSIPERRFAIRELTDISARLARVSGILSRQDAYKKQWMQDISHDLRTPIAGLRGQLEGLRDGVFKPSNERYGRLLSEIERLEGMAAGISELYFLENGTDLVPTAIDSAIFAEEALRPFESAITANRIIIQKTIKVPMIRGDQNLLLRAAGNILSNAFRFIPEGGLLALKIAQTDEGWSLCIYNDGPSIPEAQLPLLFNRFFRGENSRSTAGSGLGLNIVQEIARRHGGTIKAENRARPAHPDYPPAQTNSAEAEPATTGVCFTLGVPWSH